MDGRAEVAGKEMKVEGQEWEEVTVEVKVPGAGEHRQVPFTQVLFFDA